MEVKILRTFNNSDLEINGKFFVVEGPHASGKTIQAMMLHRNLKKSGIKSIYTKEPYHPDFTSLIEKHSEGNVTNSPILMNLIAADRYLHIQDIISWLKDGVNVISDRYVLSSFVYQQIQRFPLSMIKLINNFLIKPVYTFYLEVPIKERESRLNTRSRKKHFFLIKKNIVKEQELYKQITHGWDSAIYGKLVNIDGMKSITQINSILYKLILDEIK